MIRFAAANGYVLVQRASGDVDLAADGDWASLTLPAPAVAAVQEWTRQLDDDRHARWRDAETGLVVYPREDEKPPVLRVWSEYRAEYRDVALPLRDVTSTWEKAARNYLTAVGES